MMGVDAVWTLKLAVRTHEENGVWVADCPALDIASQGNDPEDAVKMLREAVGLVMERCLEKNTWIAFLEERGVTPTRHSMASFTQPKFDDETNYVEFPIWIISDAGASTTASGRS